jgi:hypothetical protein
MKQAHKNKDTCMYHVCFTSGTLRATVNRHEHHMILNLYWETLVYVNKYKYNISRQNQYIASDICIKISVV